MPVARSGALFGLPISEATMRAINEEARQPLEPTVAARGEALKPLPVAQADETGMRVAGQLHGLHALATATLSWVSRHSNRGLRCLRDSDRGRRHPGPGGFRTRSGLETFCTLHSYLATLQKQGAHLVHALTLQGKPPQPRFTRFRYRRVLKHQSQVKTFWMSSIPWQRGYATDRTVTHQAAKNAYLISREAGPQG
jgi:hypothetical protein